MPPPLSCIDLDCARDKAVEHRHAEANYLPMYCHLGGVTAAALSLGLGVLLTCEGRRSLIQSARKSAKLGLLALFGETQWL